MNVLVICQGPPTATNAPTTGSAWPARFAKRDGTDVKVFLIGDAAGCAIAGQKVPDGYYHLDRMITSAARHGTEIGCCGTCLDARGISDDQLIPDAHRSTLEELADWVLWADKTVTF